MASPAQPWRERLHRGKAKDIALSYAAANGGGDSDKPLIMLDPGHGGIDSGTRGSATADSVLRSHLGPGSALSSLELDMELVHEPVIRGGKEHAGSSDEPDA